MAYNINSIALPIELYADNILLTRNNSDRILLWKDKTFRIKVVPLNQSKCTIIPYQLSKEISNGKMEFIQLIRRDGFVKEATFKGNKLDLKDWLTLAEQKRCNYVIFLYFDFQGIPLRFSILFDSY